MKKYIFLIFILLLSGCAINKNSLFEKTPHKPTLIEKNREAIYSLILQNPKIRNKTVIVASITNLDDLDESSKIGRIITEQLINNLTQNGIKVVEIRVRKNNIIQVEPKKGEFILSRDAKNIAKIQKANAVLVGTYSTYGKKLYVNIKLIDPKTDIIISASDYTLPLSNFIKDKTKQPTKKHNKDIFSNLAEQ